MRIAAALAPMLALLLLPACGDDTGSDDGATPTSSDGTTSTTPTGSGDTDPTGGTGLGPDDGGTTEDDGPLDTGEDGVTTTTGEATTTGGPADTGSTGEEIDQLPPTNSAELIPWLESEVYTGWAGESAPHPSTGPHFEGVWTFVNDTLYTSLEAGNAAHPEGSAAVKELFDGAGTRLGWAVEVKIQADSAGGDGWYWYEVFDGTTYADGTGEGLCTGCHGGGTDYVLSPFPLQ